MTANDSQSLAEIQEYYGKTLQSSSDLKTNACCTAEAMPKHLRPILSQIHPEILDKFYGCGSPIPTALEGMTVIDLGCGTGRDSYLLSKLVGPNGRVIGIDMTDEQLSVARKHVDYHTEKYGYTTPNVRFVQGFIEDLKSAGIEDNSVDLVVSNCVINLSPNKKRVFAEIFRVLKPGGELYFSDIFADRRIPQQLVEDPILRGECLSGALYIEDFRRMLYSLGCPDYRVVSQSRVTINNEQVEALIGGTRFDSITVRAFKLDIEDRCEDYGQVAYYLGTIPEFPHAFDLDDHHHLEKNRPLTVCSNTAAMLAQTRYAQHFKVIGDLSTHFGLFDCAPATVSVGSDSSSGGGSCC